MQWRYISNVILVLRSPRWMQQIHPRCLIFGPFYDIPNEPSVPTVMCITIWRWKCRLPTNLGSNAPFVPHRYEYATAGREVVLNLPENEMIVLTTTGCTGSPSVAISTKGCPWMVSWAGHTDANALIILNRYLLPGVMVKVSNGVLVLNPVLGSCAESKGCFHYKWYMFRDYTTSSILWSRDFWILSY